MSLDRLAPAIFVLLWSTGWVVAKYAAIHSEPFTFLAIRFALSALAFLALCLVLRVQWPGRAVMWKAIYSGLFLHGFYLGGLWWAIANGVPAGISGIIAALQPLLTAMAAPLLIGERLQPVQKAGLALGFVGIAIAISPKL
ncbi:DMT family transporter, partial [Rhizobium sp. UBA1881]